MKKILLLLTICVIAGMGCKKNTAVSRNGIINFLEGSVSIVTASGTTAAKAGDAILQGMKIVTAEKSFVDIYFGENAIKILEKSTIEISVLISDLKNNSENTELFVTNGKVMSKITKKLAKNDSFRVKTPTAIAGVRGTEFLVEDNEGKSTISCIKGAVAVKPAEAGDEKEVLVKEGQTCDIEEGKDLIVKDLAEENKRNIQNIISDFREMRDDIRKKFEDDRNRIRQDVIDQRKENKDAVEQQKAMDKQNIQNIKDDVKEHMDAIKGTATDQAAQAKGDVSSLKENVQQIEKPKLDKVDTSEAKPEIKKFKPTLD